mmetsp:Transcript_23647/g.57059  ORF Transcript_23647/g.57059 Transcript_23647/m.57059 type:complete len:452 (+) Transcript_23647:51-1406(+)
MSNSEMLTILTTTCLFIVAASVPTAFTKSWKVSPSSSLPLWPAFSNHNPSVARKSIMHRSTKTNHSSSSSTPQTKRVVLIGGGHAHVQVIKSLNAHLRPSYVHVTLIDLQSSASYSGMVPGCVSKLYTLDQVQIALDSLADWSRIDFVCGRVVGMHFEEYDGQKVVLVEGTDEDGNVIKKEIPFDVVSVDIGSTTRDFASIPGASQYTISTRPISDLVQRIQKEEEMMKEELSTGGMLSGAQVVVVGGGAAGIELSLALRARWDNILGSKLSITLIDSNNKLFPSESRACRSALKNVMKKYDVDVLHNLIVEEVTSSHVHVKSIAKSVGSSNPKDRLPYTHCIWATGAEAHDLSWALHKQCGLSVTPDRGWIRVNQNMQSLSHPSVFAAGDCCEIVNENMKSPPKAGVYAVRSGPILIENLTRFLAGNAKSKTDGEASKNDLIIYHPQVTN